MNTARALLATAFAVIIGIVGYQIGISQSLAQTGVVAPGVAPVAYYGYPFFHFGLFPFFGLLFPLLFLFVIMGVLRAAFGGRGGWRGGSYGHWSDPRSRFEDWHREQHGEKPGSAGPGSPAGT